MHHTPLNTSRFVSRLAVALLAGVAAPRLVGQTSLKAHPVISYGFSYAESSRSEVERDGVAGEAAPQHMDLGARTSMPLREGLALLANLTWSRVEFNPSADSPLPGRVEALGGGIGLAKELNAAWSGRVMLRPTLAGDSLQLSGDGFNVAAHAALGYRARPGLTWSFGVRAALRSRHPVMPLVAMRWQFAPTWMLSVGFPQTAITWRARDNLSVRAGMQAEGGDYYLADAPAPGLGDTYLNYREVRTGLGISWRLAGDLALEIDGGFATRRRFDYYDRGYRLEGGRARYLSIGASMKY